jgi:hypothetical protein
MSKETETPVQAINEKETEVICRRGRLINVGNYENEYIEWTVRSTAYPSMRDAVYAELRRIVKEKLDEDEKLIREEYARKRAATQQTTTMLATSSQTAPATGDPYAGVEVGWKWSEKDPNFFYIRVSDKLTPPARELYQKLQEIKKIQRNGKPTLRVGDVKYQLSVTTVDGKFVPRGTEYLQRRVG